MTCTNCGAIGGPMHVHQGMNYCSDKCIDEQEKQYFEITKKDVLKKDRPSWHSSDRKEEMNAKIDIEKLPSIGEYIIVDYHNFLFINGKFIDKRIWVENNYTFTGAEREREIVVTDHHERKLGRGSFSEENSMTVTQYERKHSYICKEHPEAIIIADEIENSWIRNKKSF